MVAHSRRRAWAALVVAPFALAAALAYGIYALACSREAAATSALHAQLRGAAWLARERALAMALPASTDAAAASVARRLHDGATAAPWIDPRAGAAADLRVATLDTAVRIALLDPAGRVAGGAWAAARVAESRAPLPAPLAGWALVATVDERVAERVAAIGSTRQWTLLGAAFLTLLAGVASVLLSQAGRERALARVRGDFVASVTHELRTPLTQIRMYAELLELGWLAEGRERRDAAALIGQEARRLTHLVDNVLHFSRLDRAPSRMPVAPLDLAGAAREVLASFAPLARARGVRVEAELPAELPAIADRDAVRQVLLNLLDNALKYGPDGQTIRVRAAARDDGRVALAVDDEGPGVPAAERAAVWAPFVRLPAATGSVGSGIGLSVVRTLCRAMGGDADVGVAPGGGARFRVVLPAAAPMPAPTVVPPAVVIPAVAARDALAPREPALRA